jgi:hypothetical protein
MELRYFVFAVTIHQAFDQFLFFIFSLIVIMNYPFLQIKDNFQFKQQKSTV